MPRKKTSSTPIDEATETKIIEEAPSNKKSLGKKPFMLISLILTVLILVAVGGYAAQNNLISGVLKGKTSEDAGEIVENVRKLMVIPENETPTIATVTDKSKLEGQLFFKKAENGDKLLMFASLNEAILYRPSVNKVVNVAPLNTNSDKGLQGAQSPNTTVSPLPSPSETPEELSVVIFNGTKRSGLARTAQTKIEGNSSNFNITKVGNAVGEYKKTIIVDVKGGNGKAIDQLIKITGGTKSQLPEEETEKPDSDILIILGDDFEE